MPTLAPKLPYTHPFAGGYPRVGGQPLPTDPDAIDYLERVAAADGAAVEVGVAMAIDAFVKGCKADGTWTAIKASCILCGARTISGALVPLVGTAPTAYSFASGDYDRSSGLKGNGSTKYLDTNRANNADGQDDQHFSVLATTPFDGTEYIMGSGVTAAGTSNLINIGTNLICRSRSSSDVAQSGAAVGFVGFSRSDGSEITMRGNSQSFQKTLASQTPGVGDIHVYATNGTSSARSDARLAFYSIGSALDLALLDARVSTLVAAIAAAL